MGTAANIVALVRDVCVPLALALIAHMHFTAPPPQPPAPPIIFGPAPVAPEALPLPLPPEVVADPAGATVKIAVGNSRCTATILQDRPSGGGYYLLSAAHCVKQGKEGTVTCNDGQQFRFRVCCVDGRADLALSTFQAPQGLPGAALAVSEPPVGTAVWHQGYGIDKPGNKESGTVSSGKLTNGQLAFVLSVSSGDSGSGIFRQDTGELIAVVSSAGGGKTYGGSVAAVRKLLASSSCRP